MEIQIQSSILFIFFCFFLVIILKRSHSKKSIKTLPPGPWKLPLIGNLHQLVGSLPHHSLRDLANKYGPFMHLQLGETSNVIVSSPELAKEIMKTHDTIFANRPSLLASKIIGYGNTDIGFSPYGSYWRQLRKICILEVLSAKRVQSFRYIREEEVSSLVKHISENEGSIINLTSKVFPLTNSITARAAFGNKSRNVEAIVSIIKHMLELAGGFTISDLYPSLKILHLISGMKAEMERVHKEGDRIIEQIIRDHKERKGSHIGEGEEDLVDVLLRIQNQNDLEIPLSHDNVKAIILDVFIGGTETAATTVEWVMSELLRNSEAMKEAQAEVRRVYGSKGYVDESQLHELKYVGTVIKETLRLHPPLPLLIPRENSEGCEINGYIIPRKTRVIINGWAIGRDPRFWSDPEKFQPERFLNSPIDYNFKGTDFEYLPFGSGRRMCPGITYATSLVDIILANLLYHFDWKLPNGVVHEELDMSESFSATVRRKHDLCLVPIRYHL